MKQSTAVFMAICAVKGSDSFTEKVTLNEAERAQVFAMVLEGFNGGTIDLSKSYDEKALKSYTNALISNQLRKDTKLNGGAKYEPASTGTRSFGGDEQIKQLRLILKTDLSDEDKRVVEAHIEARVTELEIAKQPTVDWSKVPEAVRLALGK